MTSRRWERWHVRPARQSRLSRPRRARYTSDDLDGVIGTSMDAGEIMGRRWGKRDAMRDLARMTDDELRALRDEVRDEVLREHADDLLDVADAAGVTPLEVFDPEHLVDEIEQHLRDLEGGGA